LTGFWRVSLISAATCPTRSSRPAWTASPTCLTIAAVSLTTSMGPPGSASVIAVPARNGARRTAAHSSSLKSALPVMVATLQEVGHRAGAGLRSALTSFFERKEPGLLVGRRIVVLRRGALAALALLAMVAAPASARLEVTTTNDLGLRALSHEPSESFGSQPTGSTTFAHEIVFTNPESESTITPSAASLVGGNSADFNIVEDDCDGQPLLPSRSCSVFVNFGPFQAGTRSTTLRVPDSFEDNNDVALSGTGTVHIAHTPASLAFGNQNVGSSSATRTITLTNDHPVGDVTFSGISLTGTDAAQFSLSQDCPNPLSGGAQCHVVIGFNPTSTGAKSASVVVTSNSTSSPDTIPLSGNGVVHLAHAPASIAFGNQLTNTQGAVQNVTFTNDSGAAVTPGAATITGTNADQFGIASNGCTSSIAPGGTCVIGMRFQPTTTGGKTAALNLASNSAGSPDVIGLDGTGTTAGAGQSSTPPGSSGPGIRFDAQTLAFGSRIVAGGPMRLTLTLTNNGGQPLVITAVGRVGPHASDFTIATNGCSPQTLQPTASCTVDVDFLPGAAGDRTASLLVTDNAPGSPQALPLTGSGLPPPTLYTTANAEPVSGDVTVALPPTAGARASVLKGRKFIPLREARQVPIGSIFNTRTGRVRIATATQTRNKAQAGQFFAGFFQLLQRRSEKSLTEAKLVGSNFKTCTATGKGRSAQIAKKKKIDKKVVRTLRADVKGKFRTRGRYAAATVRGTAWSMQDRCDGTFTRVQRGTVVVRDLKSQRSVTVKTGKSVLVPKR
jgi:hypothetical protein